MYQTTWSKNFKWGSSRDKDRDFTGPKHTDILNSSQLFPTTNITFPFFFFLSVYPLCLAALVSLLHYTRWPSSFHGNSKTLRTKFLHFRLLVPRWLAFHKSSCWNFRYYYQYFKKSKISKQLPTIKLFKLGKMSGYFVWGWILLT